MQISIKVIGIGGAGCNALNILHDYNMPIELIGINTDLKSLSSLKCEKKLQLGSQVTRGLGTAGDTHLGKKIVQDSEAELKQLVAKGDLIFLIVGMGGGLGTVVAPEIIKYAAQTGAMVICFAIMPFSFEGAKRLEQAHEGLKKLQASSGKVVPLYNDILIQNLEEQISAIEAFNLANEWISNAVVSVCSIVLQNGIINLDFATLRETFSGKFSRVLFGLGKATGENYLQDAFEDFVKCPLLENTNSQLLVDKLLLSVIGGRELTLEQANQIIEKVKNNLSVSENVVVGVIVDDTKENTLSICAIGSMVPASNKKLNDKSLRQSLRSGKNIKVDQNRYQGEFAFDTENDQRGYFSSTEKTLYNGQDLDIPTYIRKGIKVTL